MFNKVWSAALMVAVVLSLCAGMAAAQSSHELMYPRFEDYGGVFAVEGAGALDQSMPWKIVLDVTEAGSDANPHEALTHAARALNLLELAKIPETRVAIALVVHGNAIPLTLSDEAYRRAHGKTNPSRSLLERLSEYDVSVKVCAQSLLHSGFDPEDLHPAVDVELSAMTALTSLQREGYGLVP